MNKSTTFMHTFLLKWKQFLCSHNNKNSTVINTTHRPDIMLDSQYVHTIYTRQCENCKKVWNTTGIEPKQNIKS